jgi:peptidoglycan/xylan/chitin deacetylase (PgdA/CDA1 family)
LIRELPRGPFGAYLHAHYRHAPSVVSRFAMGCGAIFMIQRARPQIEALAAPGTVAETDPMLLDEMVALVIEQGLDVVSVPELARRLAARDYAKRFVAFTFDGAYKSTLASVAPLFRQRRLPYALFVGTDFLGTGRLPWWMALEALVARTQSIRFNDDRKAQDLPCADRAEKRDSYARLFRLATQLPPAERASYVENLCHRHNMDLAAVASEEMASGGELKALAEDPRVTIGSNGGGLRPLSELSYDEAKDDLTASLDKLDAVLGFRPRHIAYPGSQATDAGVREFRLAEKLGVETAVTAVEGALWPEHAGELFTLPRIALDSDPATLVRALMLSGGAAYPSIVSAANRESA